MKPVFKVVPNSGISCPQRTEEEGKIQNSLSTTPAQMERLLEQGLPISSQMLDAQLFYDGDQNPSWDIPIDQQRGIDIADIWAAEYDARENFKKAGIDRRTIKKLTNE